MFKGFIIDYNSDFFQEIIISCNRLQLIIVLTKKILKSIMIDYNFLICQFFVNSKLYANYILWVIVLGKKENL